ncbi:MFS transporter [Rhizobium sp. BE258]|jgi:predicted MFS family arabinose efflux permease|uniref:MFS transporter n=1 Tax=Rhizobium sp. BE258 TaxID=2817722 RepID=UPI000DD86459|nr:MFS transporter [Rhizobium sp. BE258]MDR7141993.1 putative MFS family arabinose efflux permease [Rhizobium sp. BE258]
MTGQSASEPAPAGQLQSVPPRLITLILLTALSVLPVNLILPSLPEIAADLRADPALVALSVAAYAALTAFAEIIGGALSDRFGRRPVVLSSLSVFILASAGCALADNIHVFLLFRTLQAAIAACFSIALVIVKESWGGQKAASKFGYLAMGWAVAPMIGPTIGGSVSELFGWRANFVMFAVLGAIMLALAAREIRDETGKRKTHSHGYLAAYRLLLGSPRFLAYAACMACSMGTLYVFLAGAPLVMNQALGGSSARLGLYMGLVPAGFILGSYLAGRYAGRIPIAAVLVAGRAVTCTGLLGGLALAVGGLTAPPAFFAACIFIGIGNGLTMPAANSGILAVQPDLAGTAAGLAAAVSVGGGAVIASIAGLLLNDASSGRDLLYVILIPAALALVSAGLACLLDRRKPIAA